jgi:hypothetical protein
VSINQQAACGGKVGGEVGGEGAGRGTFGRAAERVASIVQIAAAAFHVTQRCNLQVGISYGVKSTSDDTEIPPAPQPLEEGNASRRCTLASLPLHACGVCACT